MPLRDRGQRYKNEREGVTFAKFVCRIFFRVLHAPSGPYSNGLRRGEEEKREGWRLEWGREQMLSERAPSGPQEARGVDRRAKEFIFQRSLFFRADFEGKIGSFRRNRLFGLK